MSLWSAVAVFAVAAGVVVVTAPRMAKVSDALVARTSIGAALFGALFLGASTSLPGIIVTVTAALRGEAGLAAGNALGGITAQTMFVALADGAYGRHALQRAALSRKATAHFALVIGLLSLVVVALATPTAAVGVHATTPVLIAAYIGGLVAIRRMPQRTDDIVDEASSTDVPVATPPEPPPALENAPLRRLWLRYGVYALLLAGSGVALSTAVGPIATAIGLELTAAGALLTGLATSSPELLTAVAAARRGALGLAVGDIAGGNAFDVLFLAAADIALAGALYGALGRIHLLLAGVPLVLNAVLLLGFLRRGRAIGGRVSPESVIVMLGYVVVVVALLG